MRKSLQTVRRMAAQYPEALVIMTGCGTALPDFVPPLPGMQVVCPGPGWLVRCADIVRCQVTTCKEISLSSSADDYLLTDFQEHTRAFLKIQDGCDNHCGYCIVPALRGPSRDKPLGNIVREAQQLAAAGKTEIVVTGVSIGLYGQHGGPNLAAVLRALESVPGIRRLRMSSLHPGELTVELLEVWAASRRLMPHVHLPLQSGSTRILKAMRRGYTREDFLDAVERVQHGLNHPALTTDVIAGYPGENSKDFDQTMALCRQVGFSRMHVFPYSQRPGTQADRISAVPGPKVQNRCEQLRLLAGDMAKTFNQQMIGCVLQVLVESAAHGCCRGYSERYVPVEFAGGSQWVNRIVPVEVKEADEHGAKGLVQREVFDSNM
jgi:threonylcarbamoyladenosine tRNA methylthiotransferase MtaB